MEFTIICPVDGPVTVSIEDIETVVLHEPERAEVTFICPDCGTHITVVAAVPSFLLSAIEALAEDGEAGIPEIRAMIAFASATGLDDSELAFEQHDPVIDAYCEYFHRQLSHVTSVSDALAEMDSRASVAPGE